MISSRAFKPVGWHSAAVPTTVVAALVADKTYPDPDFGMNLRTLPGTTYKIGSNFSNQPMPADSPFRVAWWYRTEFTVPAEARGQTLWLRFEGLNYRANVWLNGQSVGQASQLAGAYRIHELDVTRAAHAGPTNVLAVEVFPPEPGDLAITFVDWNPMPPDKDMGIYRDVALSTTGAVRLRHAQVLSRLDQPTTGSAELTVKVVAQNASQASISGALKGRIGGLEFSLPVVLAPGESRELRVTPADQPQLVLREPRLWWPWELGTPSLYALELKFVAGGVVSDRLDTHFGVREFSSEMTDKGHRVFKVNGRRILIRGAGYTPDMLLRASAERQEAEVRYVKGMNLNTIRLEGKLENEQFFDMTDREGILVMPGWCCCDHWEQWKNWKPEDHIIAAASLRDQIHRLRSRASVFVWLNGSDNPPPAPVEQMYLDILKELEWPNPVVSSATEKPAELTGASGVKMAGPYEYEPPIYWQWDKKRGGAFGFATEIGPGPSVPPLESLKRMLPADHLWPIDDVWNYHAGGGKFSDIKVFTEALERRYGPATDAADFARKAQAAAYESHRAMFEAYGQNKYTATGVIQWMQDNAWPSLIWHLYDSYLRPGGSYFGAQRACEPLHVQYSPADRSIWVVNSHARGFEKLKVTAQVFDAASVEKLTRTEVVNVSADGVAQALVLPEIADLSATYFLMLTLADATGKTVSRNFYWLSTRPDLLDDSQAQWYVTPMSGFADLTALATLPPATLRASSTYDAPDAQGRVRVALENTSAHIAFLAHLSVRQGPGGAEVLPILWSDNYVSLVPGERREIEARFALEDLGPHRAVVRLDGWNVAEAELETGGPAPR